METYTVFFFPSPTSGTKVHEFLPVSTNDTTGATEPLLV